MEDFNTRPEITEEEQREESEDLLEIYLREVRTISPLSEEEEERCAARALSGDTAARDRLTEGYLTHALMLLKDHMGGPLSVGEMIGISNLSVVKAVRAFLDARMMDAQRPAHIPAPEKKTLKVMVTEIVESDLGAAEERERRTVSGEEEIAQRANRLTEVSRVMADELGRAATEEELAERMRITADEVRDLIAMSMRAMESN